MWVCSAITNESKPRSSIARASDTGSIPSSVPNVELPIFIRHSHRWTPSRKPGSRREYSQLATTKRATGKCSDLGRQGGIIRKLNTYGCQQAIVIVDQDQ